MAKKNKKKNNAHRKSSVSIGDKAARQGGHDPNAKKSGMFGTSSPAGMVVGLVIIIVTVVLLAFQ